MGGVQDISWLDLMLGYILLIIPLYFLYYYQTRLVKAAVIAVLRMTIQLFLVGFYLEWFFKLNNAFINIGWVFIMILIASFTTIRRSSLNKKMFLAPILISITLSVFFVVFYTIIVVVGLDYAFEARYLIPIAGMLLGNSMSNNIIALNTFYDSISKDQNIYRYSLANGGTKDESLKYFMSQALRRAVSPSIATTAVMGLISLPGMMTGQILGGSNPMVAIKYQIMMMIIILTSSMITIMLSIKISSYFVFDQYDMPKKGFRK